MCRIKVDVNNRLGKMPQMPPPQMTPLPLILYGCLVVIPITIQYNTHFIHTRNIIRTLDIAGVGTYHTYNITIILVI